MSTDPTADTAGFRPCILVPAYDNPLTVRAVACAARRHLDEVLVVDDGSGPAGREAVAALGRDGVARIVHRPVNGGKGAAVATGFTHARRLGYTHALQVDADGQHDLGRIPAFLAAAAARRDALVLGYPTFDASAPRARLWARRITRFWVNVETGGPIVVDPMVGFRVYPLHAAVHAGAVGRGMEYDIEVVVRMVWAGTPVINLPVGIRYLGSDEGGVSHFRLVRDNLHISWLHTRLTTLALLRRVRRPVEARWWSPRTP